MVFVFGEYTLDVKRRELRQAGVVLPLEPKAFTVLVHLLTQRHRAVSKDELLATCWPGEFITEAALTRCLKVIRQAVGDDGVRQSIIKTLRGYGYRFIATVETPSTTSLFAARAQLHEVPRHIHEAPLERVPAIAPANAKLALDLSVTSPLAASTELSCPQCQTRNRATRQFCAACGQALWRPCLHCGFSNDPAERFCGGCGRTMAAHIPVTTSVYTGPPQAYTPVHLAAQILARQQEVIGERKYVTVLVAGFDGVQGLHRVAAPVAVNDLLNQSFAQVVAEVHQVEGFITQVTSHGGTALFGVLLACEDHVLRALHAALGMQRAFAAFAAALYQTYGVWLTLRLGVHTGPVVVSAIDADLQLAYTAPGTTIECAMGLQQLSRAGAIVVSAAVRQQAVGFFQFTAMGTHTLTDLTAPVDVYTCDSVGPVTSRVEGSLARQHTALQGRQQELALLQACWMRACRGEGQIICLVGEAGIGKSRLAYECQQVLGAARWLTAQAFSYGQAMPYHTFLPLLRVMLGVQETDPSPQQREAIRTRLAAIDPALAADTPLLAHLLGVPLETETLPALAPDVQRRLLQQACLHVLVQQAAEFPLALLVEDGHWLDPSSQDLLDLLSAFLARRPILVLCTARPGFRHAWADYTYFHQVTLAPLTADEINSLLQNLLQPYGASATLAALIRERTGGNPFFVEELVRAMQMQGLLTIQGGMYTVATGVQTTLPVSIQGLVQARLDRLPVEDKHLLQMAAVIGPEVPLPLLRASVRRVEEDLHWSLTHLQALEFLYETRTMPTSTYTFKHALVQDAIYQALLPSTRQTYHQQIAQVLEEQCAEMVEAQPEVVAQHYTAAGRSAQAIPYWQRAGQRALERSAYAEAIAHLTQGLELLRSLPKTLERTQQELTLCITLGTPLIATKGYAAPEVERTYARARDLCRRIGDTPYLFPALVGLVSFYVVRAELQIAQELGERCFALTQRVQNPALFLQSSLMLGSILYYRGAFVSAHTHLQEGTALYAPHMHHVLASLYTQDPGVGCQGFGGLSLWFLGYPDQARTRIDEALALARELSQPYSLAFALFFAVWLSQLRGEVRATQEWAAALITLSSEQGFPFWAVIGTRFRSWAFAAQGQKEEGMAQVHQSLTAYRTLGAELASSYWGAILAAMHGELGQTAEAQIILAEAIARMDKTEERFYEAELYRLKGELCLQQAIPDTTQAETFFQQARAIARCQHAKALELRVAMSLARLWQHQGKRQEAHALLAPIYGWFTEGFGTHDLQEAQALLEDLM